MKRPTWHHQCDRTAAWEVQPADQDPDRAAIAGIVTMHFWALRASGQINMRKIGDWKTASTQPIAQSIDLAA
jgi:hypothetical protein